MRSALPLLAALALSLTAGASCILNNFDHCVHRGGSSWCEEQDGDRDFCSPCEASNDGCVSEEPTEEDALEESKAGNWHTLRIDIVGNLVDAWVDGDLIATHEFPSKDVLHGSFGLAKAGA